MASTSSNCIPNAGLRLYFVHIHASFQRIQSPNCTVRYMQVWIIPVDYMKERKVVAVACQVMGLTPVN